MKLLVNIIKNFSSLSMGQAISGLLNFFAIIILARRLNAFGFGSYSFAESTFSFFMMFIVFGTDYLGSRHVAQEEHRLKEFVSEIFGLRFLMSLFCFLILVIVSFFIKQDSSVKYLNLIFGLAFFTFAFLLNWLFLGLQRIKEVNTGNIIREFVFFAGILFFIHRKEDLLLAGLIFVVSRLSHTLYLLLKFKQRFGTPGIEFNFKKLKKLRAESFPILFSSIEGWIVTSFDLILIGFLMGPDFVGYYSAAFKPIFLLITVSAIYYMAIFPLMSKAAKNDAEDFKKIIKLTLYGITALCLPIIILGYQLSSVIITRMYSNAFLQSIPVFKILIFSLFFTSVNLLYSRSLISCGRQKENSYVSAIIIIVNVLFNIVLVPRFGLMGAAVAKVMSWLIAWPFYHMFLRRYVRFSLIPAFSGSFPAAIGMFFLFILFKNYSIWLRICVEIFAYLVIFSAVSFFWWGRQKNKTAFVL